MCSLTVRTHVDVGFGNELYVRGESLPGLSWEKGVKMVAKAPSLWEWTYAGERALGEVQLKILLNDEVYQTGPNIRVADEDDVKEIIPSF